MQTSRPHHLRGAGALRFGLRRRAHWLSGSWVSSPMAIASTMIRRSGSADRRRQRHTRPGPVMSRYHRRLPLAEPQLPVLRLPRLCLPLRPISSLDLLRILLCRRRLHESLVKQAMPPHRIATIRRRTREQSRGMRPGSPDPRHQCNKRFHPVKSGDHRHLLPGELQLAMLSSPRPCLPLRPISAVHLLRMLLRCRLRKGSLQAVAVEEVRA
ncbi:hypothetical protein SAMN05192539_10502 [Paraburkholderia diazotrophica]|uniref:Uncharacterized protein n=1 Tax=Paraburkholderia diazotrophica TaxID=667676 RepID=A0A1H7EAR3_9BURK|nr:hypothetical protein SAMN05192539_10502 [Paraburkholderia diazotrophica]